MAEQYYAEIDPSGRIVQCLTVDAEAPTPAVQGHACYLIDKPIDWGAPTSTSAMMWRDGAPAWVEIGSLDDCKAAKLADLAQQFSQRMAAVKAGYPDEEVLSWAEQKAEALAFTADPAAVVPLLSNMATARGITVDDLAARVLAKAHGWAIMSGALIGKRQAYEDAVAAAADIEGVRAIVWEA